MFDFSFGEMLIVALVALVVLGPERLPKAARLAGLWVRRARAHWYAVKSELEQELAADELKRSLRETRGAARNRRIPARRATDAGSDRRSDHRRERWRTTRLTTPRPVRA